MKKLPLYILCLLLCSHGLNGFSQSSDLYMTKQIRKAYEKETRDWNGIPGVKYWQNSSDYKIEAEFIPDSAKVVGYEQIDYYNNSPQTLRSIRLMMKQNMYKKGTLRDMWISNQNVTDGVYLKSVIVNGDTLNIDNPRKVRTMATSLFIVLDSSSYVSPGSKSKIELSWELKIPYNLEMRTGRVNDSAFFAGYWFPQIVVYDDIMGWDYMFHTGLQETYNDVSNFDVKLKVPGDFMMWATGDLQNPEEIYTTDFFIKIEESKKTDQVVHLISDGDLKNKKLLQYKPFHIWHYKAANVPDFAFAISNNYNWDATSVVTNTESDKRTWVNVAYNPKEVAYKRVINWAKESVNYFSYELPGIPFPYNKHITFLTQLGGGMEFPMMAANGAIRDSINLAELTAHEIAHSYFPFYVNTNEEKYAWMDEGWVTMFGHEYLKSIGYDHTKSMTNMGAQWGTELDIPLMTPSSHLNLFSIAHYYYIKSLKANNFLFEIFKNKGLPHPLKEFMLRWKYKHPTPYDYFFTMNELLGEDLSWYWKPWYFEFCSPDLKIESVNQTNKNVEIRIVNSGKMPVPIDLNIELEDGEIHKNYETAYIWKNATEYTYTLKTKSKVTKVTLGNKEIPDATPENNVWENGDLMVSSHGK